MWASIFTLQQQKLTVMSAPATNKPIGECSIPPVHNYSLRGFPEFVPSDRQIIHNLKLWLHILRFREQA